MKNLIYIGFTLISISCFSQDEVLFKSYLKPNKVYKTIMLTKSTSEIDFEGNQDIIEKIKSSGIQLPMIVSGTNDMRTTTTNGDYDRNMNFKTRTVYDNVISKQTMNGVETFKDSPMSGLITEGFLDKENKLTVDTVISDKIDVNTRTLIKSTIGTFNQQIPFPDKPMKIGDKFDQQIPMQIPIAGLAPVNVSINTTYTLLSIQEKIAVFDVFQDVTIDTSNDKVNVSVTGNGTGQSHYDILNNSIRSLNTDLTMVMKMTMEELIVNAKINAISEISIEIE